MNKTSFLSLTLIIVVLASCGEKAAPKKTPKEKRESEKNFALRMESFMKKVVIDSKLEGSILLFDFQKERYYSNDHEWAKKELLPASTFKIPNSIIGIEAGVISDTTIFKWDGKKRENSDWEADLTLAEAFQKSCVPCYQEVAQRIGYAEMKRYLGRFNYGSMEFTEATLDNFWLSGNSKISQYQQIDFIERFYHDGLGVSEKTSDMVKEIMLIEKTDKYQLYGKTGWGLENNIDNGWFVGFVKSGTKIYFFATNVIPKKDFNMNNFKPIRKEITLTTLKETGWLK